MGDVWSGRLHRSMQRSNMSKSNKPTKVLRVALRRIQNGWTKGRWSNRNKQTGVTEVCIEGAIFGFVDSRGNNNPACGMASAIVLEVIREKYPKMYSIPQFNDDHNTTQEMIEDVMKTALIRAETGGLLRNTEEECYE